MVLKVSILNEKNDREKINQNHNTVVTNLSSHALPKGSFKKYVGSKLPVFDPPSPPCLFLFVAFSFPQLLPPPPQGTFALVGYPPLIKKFRDTYFE